MLRPDVVARIESYVHTLVMQQRDLTDEDRADLRDQWVVHLLEKTIDLVHASHATSTPPLSEDEALTQAIAQLGTPEQLTVDVQQSFPSAKRAFWSRHALLFAILFASSLIGPYLLIPGLSVRSLPLFIVLALFGALVILLSSFLFTNVPLPTFFRPGFLIAAYTLYVALFDAFIEPLWLVSALTVHGLWLVGALYQYVFWRTRKLASAILLEASFKFWFIFATGLVASTVLSTSEIQIFVLHYFLIAAGVLLMLDVPVAPTRRRV